MVVSKENASSQDQKKVLTKLNVSIDTLFCNNLTLFWYDMVKFCVHKKLLFHYYLLSPCIVMCKTYLVQCIASLFVFIVCNIGNERNVILVIVTVNILEFLDVY
jgi:hypothetical protein